VSPKKWPWHRWVLLSAILLAVIGVSVFAGWLLATRSSSSSSAPTTTKTFSDQTVSVTIPSNVLNPGPGQTPDNADKVPPDQPGSVVTAVIPGAAFEKLAPPHELWVHEPSPSLVSKWGPTIATLLVGSSAAIGVIVTWQQKNRADKRSEWWRRTAWAFERTFSVGKTEAAQTETVQPNTAQTEAAQTPQPENPQPENPQAEALQTEATVATQTEATVGWKVLETLMRSKLATADDSDIVQVIGEQVALAVIEQREGSDGNGNVAQG
jgi:hypothetical protein